jgi:outer membrane protein assembly factor BamB
MMRSALLAVTLGASLALLPACSSPNPPVTGTGQETPALKVAEDDWPWWRGPTFDGKSREQKAPTRWSPTENIAWKTEVPGRGHSSPVLWGKRIFLTSADEKKQQQLILAFDRATGKQLWSVTAHEGGFTRKYPKNSHASATQACDGERLFSVFINRTGLFVTATDLDGKELWKVEAGSFQSEHGYGSSPVLFGSLVIVNGDNPKGCFLAALDRATGKVVWRTERTTTGVHGSYASPIVATLAGKPQLLLAGMHDTSSYEPLTGKLIWSCTGPAEVTANTVAFSDNMVFSSGGFPEKELLAIKADGKGDVTKTQVAWQKSGQPVTYVPSPLYHDGRLYVVNDNGIATCFQAADGKQLWQERLDGNFSSSPVLAGDLIYVTNEAGKTFVLKAGPKFERVAVNDLDDGGFATPTICGGQIFLRSSHYLWCIGK